jgi:thioester reductase-like protein
MFALQDSPKLTTIPGLSLKEFKVDPQIAQFDLSVCIENTADKLIATFEYNTDLFDDATITRMVSHYHNLLAGIVINPQAKLSALPLLSEQEKQQLLVEWNPNLIDNSQVSIQQLFEQQVAQNPDAVAVIFNNQQLTYRQLNERANQLANYLQQIGVKPEVLVGVYLERSLEIFVAVLAIIKAGGAYLPNNLQPVPIGVWGEIYLGGSSLARGYLNNPELTKKRFSIPPVALIKGGVEINRLYKTGDKARYLPDGNIEFLGRIDNQVKIRGFRVELAEIEAILDQHPAVKQAAVALKQNANNESKLIAYLVLKENTTEPIVVFKNFLQQQLPEYGIPSAFIFLDQLPITINGKCDRDSLPTPDLVDSATTPNYVAPRTVNEQKMADIWQEILGVQVGIYDNFFDLGGHSLLIVRLFACIRHVFKIDLPFQFLFDAPILINFVEKLESFHRQEETETQTLDLKQEAFLDCTISLQNSQFEYPKAINNIFLTGATGFLGAFLLAELLRQTEADIYCLVRADNLVEGKLKIEQSLVNYLIWQDSFISRIITVIGDLSQPFLGLSASKFQSLAESIDLIYHNGAWVHHAMPYSTLKSANVLGTKEVLRLASTEKIKPVHFISTISVFSGINNSGNQLISETAKIDDFTAPEGGYVQSKWVADKLVSLGRDRGLPVTIYRPGGISGDSKTGVFNPNDFLYRLLIGCIELGAIPQGDVLDSLMPVDYVSRAIVNLSLQPESLGKAFHLVNSQRLDFNILTNLIRDFGYELQELSEQQWQAKLTDIAENQPEHPLYPLISLLSSSGDTQNAVSLKFDSQNTLEALGKTGVSLPPMDEKLLHTYLSYLHHNGFLKNVCKVGNAHPTPMPS